MPARLRKKTWRLNPRCHHHGVMAGPLAWSLPGIRGFHCVGQKRCQALIHGHGGLIQPVNALEGETRDVAIVLALVTSSSTRRSALHHASGERRD